MPLSKDRLASPPKPSPSRRDSVEIVDAITEAALALGDPSVSVNVIAERAGVGTASLYRYFPNKEAIYAEVARRLQQRFLVQLRAILDRTDLTIAEAIEACCRIAVIVPEASPALRKALNLALPLSWSQDTANETFSRAMAEITAWLTQRLPARTDLAERVFVSFSAARGLILMSRLVPERAPADDDLVRYMVKGTLSYLDLDDRTR